MLLIMLNFNGRAGDIDSVDMRFWLDKSANQRLDQGHARDNTSLTTSVAGRKGRSVLQLRLGRQSTSTTFEAVSANHWK